MSHYNNNAFNHMFDPLNPHQQYQSQFNQQPGSFAQRVHQQQQPQMGQHPQYNQLGGIPPGLSIHQQEMWRRQQLDLARQQHEQQQRQGQVQQPHLPLFNVSSPYSSGREIINNNRLMEFKNTVKVLKLADDDELGYYFMLDPAYVYTLLQPKLNPWSSEVKGVWFEDTGYGTVTADSELVLSTPLVTFTIGRGSCKITYAKPDEALSDDEIVNGVLPILRYIKSEYEAAEEIKRQQELARLKEVERLQAIQEGRKTLLSKLKAQPKRDLEDTKNVTPKGQIKKNTTAQMDRLGWLVDDMIDGGKQLLCTSVEQLRLMLETTEGNYHWIPDPKGGREVGLFLHETESYESPKVQILGAGFNMTFTQPKTTLWDMLDYVDTESEELADSLRLIALLIRRLLECTVDATN